MLLIEIKPSADEVGDGLHRLEREVFQRMGASLMSWDDAVHHAGIWAIDRLEGGERLPPAHDDDPTERDHQLQQIAIRALKNPVTPPAKAAAPFLRVA